MDRNIILLYLFMHENTDQIKDKLLFALWHFIIVTVL